MRESVKKLINKIKEEDIPNSKHERIMNKMESIEEKICYLYDKGFKTIQISKYFKISYRKAIYYKYKKQGKIQKKYKVSEEKKFEYTFKQKVKRFQNRGGNISRPYDWNDVLNKLKENPFCYISGEPINIYNTKDYAFDHFIPICKGGTGDLSNLKICKPIYNSMKHTMLFDEFIEKCKFLAQKY